MPFLYVSSGGRVQGVRTDRRGNVMFRVNNLVPGGFRMTARQRRMWRLNRGVARGVAISQSNRRRLLFG